MCNEYVRVSNNQGLEWVSPSQRRIGHILCLAVRPKELRNVYEVQVQGLLGYLIYYTKKVSDRWVPRHGHQFRQGGTPYMAVFAVGSVYGLPWAG